MSTPAEMLDASAPRRLGRYALRYKIAEGGMAAVYLAQTVGAHGFESWVAIKLIHKHLARDPRFVTMFLDEAKVTGMVRHPNVCSVLDFGEQEGQAYLVMEYLHGESGSAMLRRAEQGLPSWLGARLLCDAARGLHAAHELRDASGEAVGIVHRDVSPQNIVVLYDGHTKVVDFGVARAKGRLTDTRTGETKGKLAYMSPEQIRGREIDARTDVWSLGVVLWEMLTRRRLFRGENDADTMYRVLEEEIPPPSLHRPDIPKALDQAVQSALLRDPERRVCSAKELADMLEDYLYSAGKPAGSSQVARWMRDHFADKRASREAMLRAAPLPLSDVVEVEIESNSSVGTLEGMGATVVASPNAMEPATQVWEGQSGASSRTHGMRFAVPLAGLALLVLGASLGAWIFGRAEDPPAAVPELDSSGVHAAPAPSMPESGSMAPASREVAAAADSANALANRRPEAGQARGADPDPNSAAVPTPMVTRSDTHTSLRTDRGPGMRTRTRTTAEGRLNLVCIPRAQVYLRGRLLGTTPLSGVRLPAGRQRLRLRSEDGTRRRTLTVQIRANHVTSHPLVRL